MVEHGRIAIRGGGKAIQFVARERAEALEVRQEVRVELGLEVVLEQPGVGRVGVEQIDPAAVGQRSLGHGIRGFHYSRNEGSRRSSMRSSAGHSSSVILRRWPGA